MTTPERGDGSGSGDSSEATRPNPTAYSRDNRFAVARAFPRLLFLADLATPGDLRAVTDLLNGDAADRSPLCSRLIDAARGAWRSAKAARADGDESTATFYFILARSRAQRAAQMREQVRGWSVGFD